MHELGVVFHIMDSLEKVATENQVTDITKVVLELGEVSTVLEDYLQSCWKWAIRKRELFARAELVVEKLPAITWCDGCKQTYPTVEYGKIHSPAKARYPGFCNRDKFFRILDNL